MKRVQEEIAEELTSEQEILYTLKRRRRELQKKHAVRGIDTPVEVLTEIEDVTKQIYNHEEEIARLESVVAADQVPVEEIEYHAMLAEEWDKSSGRLKLAQQARLDWARVRLGISLERARAMEQPVRVQLAEELFDGLNLNYLPHNYSNVPQPTASFDFARLRKAILLDLPTTVTLFGARRQPTQTIDIGAIESALITSHDMCREDDNAQYQRFIQEVKLTLR